MSHADPDCIEFQNDVEQTETTVREVPAAAQVLQQESSIHLGLGQAGDRVGRTMTSLVLLHGAALQADQLLRTGSIEGLFINGCRGRRDGARVNATAILFHGCGDLLLSKCFTLLAGRKAV